MSRYIPARDVAKLVRAHVKAFDPDVKFHVRTEHGSTVRVYVPKDYSRELERKLYLQLTSWGSSGFDGMTDSSYAKGHTLCPDHGIRLTYVGGHWGADAEYREHCCAKAEGVHIGAGYVFVSREWRD